MTYFCTLSSTHQLYYSFWEYFNEFCRRHNEFQNEFKIKDKSTVRGYQDYSIGTSFHIVLKINMKKDSAFVGIYFDRIELYTEFYNNKRETIEDYLQLKMIWSQELTKGSAYLEIERVRLLDRDQWKSLVQNLISYAIKIKHVFIGLS